MPVIPSVLNEIPKNHYRVIQAKGGKSVLIDDFGSSEDAFGMAKQHNDSLGIDGCFREPYLVFSCLGILLFGPADGWSKDQVV